MYNRNKVRKTVFTRDNRDIVIYNRENVIHNRDFSQSLFTIGKTSHLLSSLVHYMYYTFFLNCMLLLY